MVEANFYDHTKITFRCSFALRVRVTFPEHVAGSSADGRDRGDVGQAKPLLVPCLYLMQWPIRNIKYTFTLGHCYFGISSLCSCLFALFFGLTGFLTGPASVCRKTEGDLSFYRCHVWTGAHSPTVWKGHSVRGNGHRWGYLRVLSQSAAVGWRSSIATFAWAPENNIFVVHS